MASASIEIIFRGNARGVVAAARQAEVAVGRLSSHADRGSRLFGAIGRAAKLATVAAAGFAASAGTAIVTTGIKFAALKEQAEIAFTTMLGSGEKAREFLDQLEQFAAKTPFEFPDLLGASQRLMAMGFAARDVIPMLTTVGDTVAALGGGSAEIDRVVRALGQMQAKGKVSAEEMMQLTEIGIPAWQMLARTLGVDVTTAMEMVSKRQVDAGKAIDGMLAQMRSKYGGMMEEQSRTLSGLWSTTKDLFRSISAKLIGPLLPMLKQALDWVNRFMSAFDLSRITSFAGGASGALGGVVEALRGAWEPAKSAISSFMESARSILSSLWQGIQPVLSSIGGVVTNVLVPIFERAASIVGGAFRQIGQVIRDHEPQIRSIGEKLGRVFEAVGTVIQNVARVALPVLRFVFQEVLPRAIGAAITVLDRLIGVVADVVSWFAGLHGKIVGAIAGLPGAIKGIVDRVVSFFAQLPARVMGFFAQLAGKLTGWVQTGTSKASEIGRGIRDGVANGLRNLVERVRGFFRDLWSYIKGAAGSAYAFARTIGSKIVSGIWDAIKSASGWLRDKIGGLIGGVLGGLDIPGFSPVDEAAAKAIGRPIMDGAARGVERHAVRLRRAVERAVRQALAAGESASSALDRILGSGSGQAGSAARGLARTVIGRSAGNLVRAFIAEAKKFLGVRYQLGSAAGRSFFGDDPKAFDCSGFVSYLYRRLTGRAVTAFTGEWIRQGKAVAKGQQQAGDLVFFGNPGSTTGGHMGIMLDQYRFIHASSSGGVKISDLRTYGREVTAFRRVLDGVPAAFDRMGSAASRAAGAVSRAMQRAAAAVDRAKARFESAFQAMAAKALEAFDRVTGAYETPAEKQLRLMEEQREAEELARRKAEAQRRLAEAQTAEERQAALQELADIEYEERRRALEAQAELERREYEDQRAEERVRFEQELAKLQERLLRKKLTAAQATKAITDLLKRFGIDMGSVGGIIGQAFTAGLARSIQAVGTAAADLARAIAKLVNAASGGGGGGGKSGYTPPSPADPGQPGPIAGKTFMWGGIEWGKAIGRGLDMFTDWMRAHGGSITQFQEKHPDLYKLLGSGGVVTRPLRAIVGEAGPEAVIPLDRFERLLDRQRCSCSMAVYITITAPSISTLAERRALAQEIRRELQRVKASGLQLGLA